MAEFSASSLWMRLAMMLVSGAFSMHLFAMDQPRGWSSSQVQNCNNNGNGNGYGYDNGYGNGYGNCNKLNTVRAVQALEVIGFLSVLAAFFLALCLVLLDELKGNKIALLCLCIFSILAGVTIILGIAVYEWTTRVKLPKGYGDGSEYASTVGVMAGICSLAGGVFSVLEILGMSA